MPVSEEQLVEDALAGEGLRLGLDPDGSHRARRRGDVLEQELDARLEAAFEPPSDAAIERFLSNNRTLVKQDERLRLRHVFRRVATKAPAEERARIRAEVEALRLRILAGEDFAAIARAASDSETAQFGGVIAPQARGQLPSAVEAVVWGLAAGEVSGVVETPVGFHVFRLEERVSPRELTAAQARDWAIRRLSAEARSAATESELDRLLAASGAQVHLGAAAGRRPAGAAVVFRLGNDTVTVADLERLRDALPFAERHKMVLDDLARREVWRRLAAWSVRNEKGATAISVEASAVAAERRVLAELAWAGRLARWESELPEAELSAAYRAMPARFAAPLRLRLRVLVLKRIAGGSPHPSYERLDTLAREIRAGSRDFASTARELSDDPSAADGGDLGLVLPRDFAAWAGVTALARVERMVPGELGGPFQLEVYREEQLASVPEGHLLVRLEVRDEPGERTFEEARSEVASFVARERAGEARAQIRARVLEEIRAGGFPRATLPGPGSVAPLR